MEGEIFPKVRGLTLGAKDAPRNDRGILRFAQNDNLVDVLKVICQYAGCHS
jgi:hypothetical protein